MSWLFSQALVEAFSAASCWDGEPFAQLNVMPTLHPFWHKDKAIEPSTLSRFGLTLRPLTADRGEELLMWFRAGFPARTSASAAKVQASTARSPDCGDTWRGSWAKLDRDLSSWKTAQFSLLGGLEPFSQTWPRSGSMLAGECYPLANAEPLTSANESGFWPTPTARDSRTLAGSQPPKRAPTSGLPLAWTVALMLPAEQRAGGRLNPPWVEWLMGWPMGWTDLKGSATAKFRQWQQQHGAFLAGQTNNRQEHA